MPANSARKVTKFTVDVAKAVDKLDRKHAIFLVAEGGNGQRLCTLQGLGFSSKDVTIEYPAVPEIAITVNGHNVSLPDVPVRSSNANGITGYDQYEASFTMPADMTGTPTVAATSSDPSVKIDIIQPTKESRKGIVQFTYKGVAKTYTVQLTR